MIKLYPPFVITQNIEPLKCVIATYTCEPRHFQWKENYATEVGRLFERDYLKYMIPISIHPSYVSIQSLKPPV